MKVEFGMRKLEFFENAGKLEGWNDGRIEG